MLLNIIEAFLEKLHPNFCEEYLDTGSGNSTDISIIYK